MRLRALLGAIASAGLLLIGVNPAGAAPPAQFSLSPDPLNVTAEVGGFGYADVTVRTRGALVIQSPAMLGTPTFFDTQAGSCWQTYQAVGDHIPPRSSCTIQVGFHPTSAGTFHDTLTVTRCTEWHESSGQLVCDTLGQSQTIQVVGVATEPPAALPDLVVQSIAFTAPPNYPPHSYTVTVLNQGEGPAELSGAGVQGYYSADQELDPATDSGACGVSMSGTLAAGATTDVPVGCSAPPGDGHAYLLVHVDITNVVAESNDANNIGSAPL